MESGQIHPRFGYQVSQPGNEIQGFEDDVGGPIAAGRFELISDIGRGCEGKNKIDRHHLSRLESKGNYGRERKGWIGLCPGTGPA